MKTLTEVLGGNSYPGRGIVLGKTEDGKKLAAAYFIMGRSENSRNRVFVAEEDRVMIYPADESKVEDPSLIIYAPLRIWKSNLILTNGDQTDTIYEGLKLGGSFGSALETRCFEPDAPNFTPRISGWMDLHSGKEYKLSILKSADAQGSRCARFTYHYEAAEGLGHLIHTYEHDGHPLPTFSGEPREVKIPDTAKELSALLWESLDTENRISLLVRYTDIATGETEEIITNRFTRI